MLRDYFLGLPVKSVDVDYHTTTPHSGYLSEFESLSDFRKMAQRGLYSFDKTILNMNLDNNYHLICSPKERLRLEDVPQEIQSELNKLKLDFPIERTVKIDLALFGPREITSGWP